MKYKISIIITAGFIAILLGLVAVAQPISMPHVIFGTITDAQGTILPNAIVKITNLRTDEYLTDNSNSQGQYQIDLSSLPSGYQIGDEIRIEATLGELSASAKILISNSPNDECNLVLEESSTPGLSLGETATVFICLAGIVGLTTYRRRAKGKA